jgi:SsrA-binding protein
MPTLVQNKKIHFNYEILEQYDAGIELFGYEVKTLRNKHGSLDGAHITVRGNEAFLIGSEINAYQPANAPKDYDSHRNRKLLLTKKELSALAGKEKQKGLTIVPISLYTKGRNIKLSLGVARGKKKYDKREAIKKRDTARDVARELKQQGF